jgi:hypothetical protein
MNVPTFWAREDFTATDRDGLRITRTAFGWSSISAADAARHAKERAKAAIDRDFDRHELYDYGNLPSREPVLESIDVGGKTIGCVTRNRYGCRVLNADRVLFADIDLPAADSFSAATTDLVSLVKSWFAPKPPPATASPEETALARVADWHQRHAGSALRVYRTFAGLRLLFVDRQYDPSNPATLPLLKSLGTDPLYVHLTKRQDCFRARLSPKPWRCGVDRPKHVGQFDHPDYAGFLADWAESYEPQAKAYATCRLLQTFGPTPSDPVIAAIVAYHDRHTLDPTNARPLA